MQFKVLKPVYLNGKEHEQGSIVEVSDSELAGKLVDKGTLAPSDAPDGFPQKQEQGGGENAAPLEPNQTQESNTPSTPSSQTEAEQQPQAGEVVQPSTQDQPSVEQQIGQDLQNLNG